MKIGAQMIGRPSMIGGVIGETEGVAGPGTTAEASIDREVHQSVRTGTSIVKSS